MIWQEFCLEGCRIECGNAQEALHKPHSFFCCTNSHEPELRDSRRPLCPGLARRSLQRLRCLFIQQFGCLLPPLQFPLSSPCEAMAGLCRGQRGDGHPSTRRQQRGDGHPSTCRQQRGDGQPQHAWGRFMMFPCFYPEPFAGLCGSQLSRHIKETSKTSCFFS